MDFTLEGWEQLGLDQGDLFWDTALDNYQKLFLLNPLRPNQTSCPDGGEEQEIPERGSPEVTGPDTAEAKISPLPQEFSEGLSQEILETFSKDGLWNSNFGEAYMDESWLDSLLGDPESLISSEVVTNKESSTECKSHELKSGLGPESFLFTGEDSLIHDLSEKSLTPAKSQECRNDIGSHSDQSQQDAVQEGVRPYKCSECGKSFSRSCHLIQHWITTHMAEKPTGNQEYENSFNQISCLPVYPRTHTGYKSYVCNKCGKTFRNNTHLLRHQKIHTGEKTRKSQDSDHSSGLVSQLVKQQKTHKIHKSYKCNECGKSFSRTLHLIQHQKTHTRKRYECVKCKATFNFNKYLLQHQKIHASKTTSKCQECGKTFRHSSSLIKHQSTHSGEKPYKCDECGKCFSHSLTLKSHQRVHSGEKPYKCSQCEKAFYRNTHLNEHQRIHTGYRPHKCNKCVKSFSRPSHLIRHQSVHATEKPYRCAECNETFSHNERLVRHQKMHAMETRYECQECGERFICSSTLTCHQSIHTQEKQGLDGSGKILNQNLEQKDHPRSGEKHFKCNTCEKTFSCSKYLTQHERLHTREKPFECKQCGKAFVQSAQLIHHEIIHSGVRPYKLFS
ncbi:zinc finger protein 473 isoform X2 [Eptesicus fuscus]|uniref:zinc finger protein 473 isoform X2 n=1 Tax=Eptesicus fuscus TaxID=29078 RepID=UPI0024042FDC|nr:zinc finger protein 473 isoform X2 [Eptesicus fuscus]